MGASMMKKSRCLNQDTKTVGSVWKKLTKRERQELVKLWNDDEFGSWWYTRKPISMATLPFVSIKQARFLCGGLVDLIDPKIAKIAKKLNNSNKS